VTIPLLSADLPADAALVAARAALDAQHAALGRLRHEFEAAVERLPRSAGSTRGAPAHAGAPDAPWKGPARLAFEASLYDLERAAIDARDALLIAEDYTRLARDGLDRAG
jgi:hypothetical protein